MAAAAAAPPETALPAAADPAHERGEEEEEQCRICLLPAEADRPLRHPCACHGSIRFVHDDCQFRWMATRRQRRCEVCKRSISTRALYAADAPARLPVSELMLSAPGRIISLLLPLFVAICVVCESAIRLATLLTWRLAFARTFVQVHHLCSTGHSTTSIIASVALWVAFAHKAAPFSVAPYARWVERLEARRHGFRGFNGWQALALVAVDISMLIVIIPLLIGLLVDLSLLSPFTGPDDDVPALGFFCSWYLGWRLQNIVLNMAPWRRIEPFLACMAYFIDESCDGDLWWLAREELKSVKLIWLLQDELLPIARKLLTALGVPYVLAKGIFPRLGYSVALNSTVYRFAWLGSLAFCVLCYLAKVFFINLHDSVRDDRYATGRRLEDVAGIS